MVDMGAGKLDVGRADRTKTVALTGRAAVASRHRAGPPAREHTAFHKLLEAFPMDSVSKRSKDAEARHGTVRRTASTEKTAVIKLMKKGPRRPSGGRGPEEGTADVASASAGSVQSVPVAETEKTASQWIGPPNEDKGTGRADGRACDAQVERGAGTGLIKVTSEAKKSVREVADATDVKEVSLQLSLNEAVPGAAAKPVDADADPLSRSHGSEISVALIEVGSHGTQIAPAAHSGTRLPTREATGEGLPSNVASPAPASMTLIQDESRVLQATPGALEVGVANGTHGWLRVRAELGHTGDVTASVIASSAAAVEGLHKELPAISAYLAHEQMGVRSLVVQAAGASAEAGNAAMSFGSAAHSGRQGGEERHGVAREESAGGTSGRENQERGTSRHGTGVSWGRSFNGSALPAALYAGGTGGWLSVRV